VFETVKEQQKVLAKTEPVISVVIGTEARAYPLRILTWHEIVNDQIDNIPLAITYCPLCNAAIVFEARVNGQPTTFGTTGKLRNSDLIMYDRATESWWQQFTGTGIVGENTGQELKVLPSRLESFERFAARYPDGKVLVPTNPGFRAYGQNPYVGYDTASLPFLYHGPMPEGIEPMARVVAIKDKAWALALLRKEGKINDGDLEINWSPGQNSALDSRSIAEGWDVGNIVVKRLGNHGEKFDIPYDVTFAFVFRAFRPTGQIIQ
jgi:hypothetical protein